MKKVFNILFLGLMLIFLLPFNVNALSVSTLNVTNSNNRITVSGTTEDGILAIAVFVYSGEELVDMETCSNNNNRYSCKLSKSFNAGEYTIKIADYNGGNYVSKKTKIESVASSSIEKSENPKTLDNVLLYFGIGCISLVGLISCGIYLKKKKHIKNI